MSPVLNGSSAIRCFECGDAIEIHSEILYMELPQTYSTIPQYHPCLPLPSCACVCNGFTGVFLWVPSQGGVWTTSARKETPPGTNLHLCSLNMSATVFTLVSFLHTEHINCQPKARYVYAREYALNYNSQCLPKETCNLIPSSFIATGSTCVSIAQTQCL